MRSAPEPAFEIAPDAGPVMVTLEYLIDPSRADDFIAVMEQTRRARLRQGALSWGLFRDRRPQLYGSLLTLDGEGRVTEVEPFERTAGVRGPGKPKAVTLSKVKKSARLDPRGLAVLRELFAS